MRALSNFRLAAAMLCLRAAGKLQHLYEILKLVVPLGHRIVRALNPAMTAGVRMSICAGERRYLTTGNSRQFVV